MGRVDRDSISPRSQLDDDNFENSLVWVTARLADCLGACERDAIEGLQFWWSWKLVHDRLTILEVYIRSPEGLDIFITDAMGIHNFIATPGSYVCDRAASENCPTGGLECPNSNYDFATCHFGSCHDA
jgi:hypothetical protein